MAKQNLVCLQAGLSCRLQLRLPVTFLTPFSPLMRPPASDPAVSRWKGKRALAGSIVFVFDTGQTPHSPTVVVMREPF